MWKNINTKPDKSPHELTATEFKQKTLANIKFNIEMINKKLDEANDEVRKLEQARDIYCSMREALNGLDIIHIEPRLNIQKEWRKALDRASQFSPIWKGEFKNEEL